MIFVEIQTHRNAKKMTIVEENAFFGFGYASDYCFPGFPFCFVQANYGGWFCNGLMKQK